MKKKYAALVLQLVFVGISAVCGIAGAGSRPVDMERRVVDIERARPETPGAMMEHAAKSMKPDIFASKVKKNAMTAYGFTSGASQDKGYFRLGVMLADLEASVRAGDREMSSGLLDDLADSMQGLGLSPLLSIKAREMKSYFGKGESLSHTELGKLYKEVEEEAARKKMADTLSFGEWAETSRLILSADKEADSRAAIEHIRKYNYAGYFLSKFKGGDLPKGVTNALGTLKGLEGKRVEAREKSRALKAFETIVQIMGG